MPLAPSGLQRRRRLDERGADLRHLGRGRHRVGGEVGVQRLAVLVVDELLEQAGAEAVDAAAEHLALGQYVVDDRAGVVDGGDPLARAAPRSRGRSRPPRRTRRSRTRSRTRSGRAPPAAAARRRRASRAARARRAAARSRPSPSRARRTCPRPRASPKRSSTPSGSTPQRVGDDLRERRRVALAVRAGGAVGDDAPVRARIDTRASSNWPPARSTYSATPVPTSRRRARARRVRARGPGSARSRRSRS